MATAETQNPPAEAAAPGLPDYVLDEDAVLKDTDVKWRHGRAPDYTKTRKIYSESKPAPPPLPRRKENRRTDPIPQPSGPRTRRRPSQTWSRS
jgi:hypothetical protein